MLSSVPHKTDVAAGSVEYPEDDGSRCAVSTGVLPASVCVHFLLCQPGGCFPRMSVRFVGDLAAT